MSYCRWSSDDHQCDVYVYADTSGGWTTHVAGRRRIIPPDVLASLPAVADDDALSWFRRHLALGAWMDNEPQEWLDLTAPSAGETFNDPTPDSCADRLEALRAEGLNVPQYAIDALREESTEPSPEAASRDEHE